jgi:hypothetical protein
MDEPGQHPTDCDFSERDLMTSCKCVAIFTPHAATVGA